MPVRLINLALGLILSVWLSGGMLSGDMWLQGVSVLQSAEPEATLPPNFEMQIIVGGLQYPTDMVLLPSGDILVAEKGTGSGVEGVAHVRLVRQGILVTEPVVSVSVTVVGDSGIYSIVLDPDFASNHYFYLWYSVGANAMAWPGQSIDRLSRFTFDPQTGKADALDETIILDGIRWSQWHNGGGLAFDATGNLLLATGDAASNSLAQDMASLNGKLLRIQPRVEGGYSVPADNAPVLQRATAQVDAHPEIYASGLRNPFRMAWRSEDQSFYLIDVGFNAWEEVNRVVAGANYGWAVREGPCPYDVRDPDCPQAPPIYTDPVVAYPHPPTDATEPGAGISALAFYSGAVWPELYQGQLFFADFNARTLSMVDLDDPKTIIPFGNEVGNLVDIEATAEGLYTLSIYDGVIRFIYYSQAGNQWPTARMSVNPMQGRAPLTVNFSAAGSSDPENDPLSYLWDFGDGSTPLTSSVPITTYTYSSDGDYRVTLQVVDAYGGRSEPLTTAVQVYSGDMPTIVSSIVGDMRRGRYRGGDEVRFSVSRLGGKAGLDQLTPYVWSVKQHHNQHIHFVITEKASDEVAFEIGDDSHAAEPAIWYEAVLTMYTDEGQKVRVSYALLPDIMALDIRSAPTGASMLWNGVPQPRDQAISAIVGQKFMLEAPEILYSGRTKNRFASWHIRREGVATEDEVITERSFELLVPTEAKSYVADYDYIGPSQVNYLPSVLNIVANVANVDDNNVDNVDNVDNSAK